MSDSSPSRSGFTGLGCLLVAIIVGLVLGFNAGGPILPAELKIVFAVLFAAFFGVLAFVFTGMQIRRDRGVVSETIMTLPARVASTLKSRIQAANPPSHLSPSQISELDADMAELDELADLLHRQPRSGTNPAIKQRLEEIAVKWLDDEQITFWLDEIEPPNSQF